METAPTVETPKKRKKTGYVAFKTIRAIMVGRHAAVDAGETRYVWFKLSPEGWLKTRVASAPPSGAGFSHWQCEPNGDVVFIQGSDEELPRAWNVPTPPLSRTLVKKLKAKGFSAEPTDNPEWLTVFMAFSVLDAGRVHGWTEDRRKRVNEGRATAKLLVTRFQMLKDRRPE